MGGKKGDRERETRGMKDGCVQEVKQGECGGERERMELLMMAMAYKNDRWNRKKQRVAKTMGEKKKMTDGKHSSKTSGVN